MSVPKIKGVTLEISGREFVVPPLNLPAMEHYEDALGTVGSLSPVKQMRLIAEVAHAALIRNYPELTMADFAPLVDLANMVDLMNAVMNVSRLAPKSGEAQGIANQ